MSFNKCREKYRKSIRRDAVEGAFDELLRRLRPSERLFKYVTVIFKHEWAKRLAAVNDMKKALRRDLLKIEKLMDQLVESDSDIAITAYERRIGRLEKDKLLKAEKLENSAAPKRGFDEMFELAFTFLSNPWKLWASEHLEDKRTLLKLAFEDRLAYCRKTGFRTPKITLPFNVLGAVCKGKP